MTSTPPRTDCADSAALDHDQHVRRHLVRNFVAHMLDGGLYIGGMAFLSGAVILPKIIDSLGGPGWLIAAMPMALILGFQIPTLLTAHIIERLERLRPLLLLLGVFQRLPYLVAAIVLFLWADDYPLLALATVALCPFVSGLVGGLGVTAWQELIANTIPPHRRSSMWAARNILSSLIGLVAGGTVLAVLGAWSGPIGYGLLHLVAFAFMTVSYGVFWWIREVPNPRRRPTHAIGLAQSLRSMPALIRSDRRLRRYLLCTIFANGIYIMLPRLSIHTLGTLSRPESYLGVLLVVQTVGGIIGNIAAGFIGDRRGGKAVIAIALVAMVALCIWATVARTRIEFWSIFFLLGGASFCYHIGRSTLTLELCPLEHRIRYLAIISACSMVGMVAVWTISTVTHSLSDGNFAAVAVLAAASIVVSGSFLMKIKEPRPLGSRPKDG